MPVRKKGKHERRGDKTAARRKKKTAKRGKTKTR